MDIQQVPSGTLSADYATNNKPAIGARHIQAIILFVAIVIGYLTKISFSAALVAMDDSNTNLWTEVERMLSAFAKGYMWLPVLAGFLGHKYGSKYFLISAIVINSIAFILIPFAASNSGSTGVTICRYIQGLSQGFLFPCVHVFLGKWAPPDERSTLTMIIYNGRIVAIIASFLITKPVIYSSVGASGLFYLYGALGLAWSVLYYFFGFNDPASHPNISTEERCYIETSLEQDSPRENNTSAPWKHIMMAVLPVVAVMTANFSSTLSETMTMTEIPLYMYTINRDWDFYSTLENSLLPHLSSGICGAIAACLSDYLIRKSYITRLRSRKLFQAIASCGELLCLVLLIYVANDITTALILITISQAFHGATFSGYIVNEIDLTPRFAGILRGISITVSQVIVMYYVLLVFPDPQDANEWKTLFIGNVIICFVTANLFICCASATKQKWDNLGRVRT